MTVVDSTEPTEPCADCNRRNTNPVRELEDATIWACHDCHCTWVVPK